MPDSSVRQQEFPFKSRIVLPEGVQPLPVRRALERSPEPPKTVESLSPAPKPLPPGILGVSEPNGAACEVDQLQDQEFPEAEADVPDQPPDLAEDVLHPRHPWRRRLPARVMLLSKESSPSWDGHPRPTHSIGTRGNFGTFLSNSVWGCVAGPRSFGERCRTAAMRGRVRILKAVSDFPFCSWTKRRSNGLNIVSNHRGHRGRRSLFFAAVLR